MNKLLKTFMLIIVPLAILGCGNSDNEAPNNKTTNEKVSFKAITTAWFEQAPDDEAPSTEEMNFEFDANDDAAAFDMLLEINIQEETI